MAAALPEPAAAALDTIRACAPEAAAQAARTLAVLFDGYVPPLPAEASVLNRGGGPLEFSCSGADLRYTVDLGGPVGTRLARIRDRIRALDPGWACPALDGWTPREPLSWGAWLGVRHRAGGPPRFKVYVETPPGTLPEDLGEAGWPAGDHRPLPPTLAGFHGEGEADRRELYFEIPHRGLPVASLERLMAQVGLERRAPDLLRLVDAFEFRHPGPALPDARLGFSTSLDRRRLAPVFSLFAFAPDLVGDERAVRWQILRRAAARGIALGPYECLTAALAEGPGEPDIHNIVAFVVDRAAPPAIQITFRPPGSPRARTDNPRSMP